MAPLIDSYHDHDQAQYMSRSISPELKRHVLPQRQRKRVAFSTFSEMYFVPTTTEMSEEELEATYMTDGDYRRIRKDIDDTMRIMKEGQYPYETPDQCYRGLEILLPDQKVQRKQRIAFMVGSVLQEQEARGQLHPEWVQKYLCALTIPFAHAAHVMGIYDSQTVFADIQAEMQRYVN